MGILDSIVEWIATQVMNLLDLITGSVLGALGCDMSTFLRYFPAAETLYEIFVAIGVGFILLNLVWQLFRNFGLGLGLSAEDPVKLAIKSIRDSRSSSPINRGEQQATACCSQIIRFSCDVRDTRMSSIGTSNNAPRAYRLSTEGRLFPCCHL